MAEKKLIRFDWAIKYVLRNKANFDVLEGFLSNLLKEAITIENIIESESNQKRKILNLTGWTSYRCCRCGQCPV
jgi:hypothetical protein